MKSKSLSEAHLSATPAVLDPSHFPCGTGSAESLSPSWNHCSAWAQSSGPVATAKLQSAFDFPAQSQPLHLENRNPRGSLRQAGKQGHFSFLWSFFEIPSKSRSWNTEGQ